MTWNKGETTSGCYEQGRKGQKHSGMQFDGVCIAAIAVGIIGYTELLLCFMLLLLLLHDVLVLSTLHVKLMTRRLLSLTRRSVLWLLFNLYTYLIYTRVKHIL